MWLPSGLFDTLSPVLNNVDYFLSDIGAFKNAEAEWIRGICPLAPDRHSATARDWLTRSAP